MGERKGCKRDELGGGTSEKDYAISFVRLSSVILIISCHFLQWLDNNLCWWLNVGVQIFLIMSGVLYAKKEITDDIAFIAKQFKKILFDYYIYLILLIAFASIVSSQIWDVKQIILQLLSYKTLDGVAHLWFIPYILLCYFLTPSIFHFAKKIESKNVVSYWFFSIAIFYIIELFGRGGYFNPAWISCYLFGFLFSFRYMSENNKRREKKYLIILITVICIIMNIIKISGKLEVEGIRYSIFYDYAHAMLGSTLFLNLYNILSKIKWEYKSGFVKFLDTMDYYSYDIYLVHQIHIISPFTLMDKTDSVGVNIFIILLIMIPSTIILKGISKNLQKLLESRCYLKN